MGESMWYNVIESMTAVILSMKFFYHGKHEVILRMTANILSATAVILSQKAVILFLTEIMLSLMAVIPILTGIILSLTPFLISMTPAIIKNYNVILLILSFIQQCYYFYDVLPHAFTRYLTCDMLTKGAEKLKNCTKPILFL